MGYSEVVQVSLWSDIRSLSFLRPSLAPMTGRSAKKSTSRAPSNKEIKKRLQNKANN